MLNPLSRRSLSTKASRLRGAMLIVAQAVWLLVAAVSLISLALSVPLGYERLTTPCSGELCTSDQLTFQAAQDLASGGISVHFYALYNLVVTLIFAAAFLAAGILVIVRIPEEHFVWYVSLTLILFGVYATELVEGVRVLHPAWELLIDLLSSAAWISFAVLLYLFPDGRFRPGWTRWLAVAWVMTQLPYYIVPHSALNIGNWPLILQLPVYAVLFGVGIWSQVYRYRNISSPVQRQQTKWVLFGLVLAAAGIVLLDVLPEAIAPEQVASGTLAGMALDGIILLVMLLLPFTLVAAILRHRLWDIDLFINRAIVYASLTLALAGVYFSVVISLQIVLSKLTGVGQSSLSIVLSTLAISALFSPLRRRIQDGIDRRFYRRRYNAERALAALGEKLRSDVELDTICEHLVAVVEETMQPGSISVWLLPAAAGNRAAWMVEVYNG